MTEKTSTSAAEALICEALAVMRPSTAAEIAEATDLDPVAAARSLDFLARQQRVMFNPLTKRFSLPRPRTAPGLAA
jgi:DNA-binding IclR family transcriptional regulator